MSFASLAIARSARSAVSATALGVAIVALTAGPSLTISAEPKGAIEPNFAFETRFHIKPGATVAFDTYWARLRDLSAQRPPGYRRHVYGTADGLVRLVTLPVVRLAEYGNERANEQGLREMLGERNAEVLLAGFHDAQVARFSHIRQYVSKLSANRGRVGGGAPLEVTSVTVAAGQERAFERCWQRVAAAGQRTPGMAFVVARTIVGDGPQFIVTRSIPLDGAQRSLDPVEAVRAVEGAEAAARVEKELRALVVEWKAERFESLGFHWDGE
jgi:hypothetical protein